MSTIMGGPEWWLASDGRWYPPETHPDYQQRTRETWPLETPAASPATDLLEMSAPGPIPPAFYATAGDPGTYQTEPALTIEHARYVGGFLPEPESQDSSFVRCTSAGVQFRTRRGVAWVPWNDVSAMVAEGPTEVSRRFAANPRLSPGVLGFPHRRDDASYLVVISGASEIIFEVNGMVVAELRQAIEPLLGRLSPPSGVYAPGAAGVEVNGPADWSPTPTDQAWSAPTAPTNGWSPVVSPEHAPVGLTGEQPWSPPAPSPAEWSSTLSGTPSATAWPPAAPTTPPPAQPAAQSPGSFAQTSYAQNGWSSNGAPAEHTSGHGRHGVPDAPPSDYRSTPPGEYSATEAPTPQGTSVDAVQQFLADASSRGLLDTLHGPDDAEALRVATEAVHAAHSAASAAEEAAHAAVSAADAVHRFTVVRTSEAEIGDLLIRCQQFIEGAIADAERHAQQIVTSARSQADVILADATRRAHELERGANPYNPTLGAGALGAAPPISPESARELNSTIDGYIRVNSELMHELRLLSGSLGVEVPGEPGHPAPGQPSGSPQAPSYHRS
jgi:hypothetical protein